MNFDCDVLIIGAGPAGTSAAIQLAKLGHKIIVVERIEFPRPHVGICLSESTKPLFEVLHLWDRVFDAGFWKREQTAVRWGAPSTRFVSQSGLHVDRGSLDQLMLMEAQKNGVAVYQPVKAIRSDQNPDHYWTITLDQNGAKRELKSRYVIDASGRASALPGKRVADGPPLFAMHAIWSIKNPPEFDGLIESGENSWLWFARTNENLGMITLFCDPNNARRGDCLQSVYERLLGEYQVTNSGVDWQQVSRVRGCDATASHSETAVNPMYLRVGDACLSVDPLASQGVHLALLSGIQGALIVHTILDRPSNAELAIQFCQSRTADRIRKYTDRTKTEYGKVLQSNADNFWRVRSGSPQSEIAPAHPQQVPRRNSASATVTVSKQVSIERVPVIDGDYVVEAAVVAHPSIDHIAYVDGIALVPLIACLPATIKFERIPDIWGDRLPQATSRKIAEWLWDQGLLVEQPLE